MPGGTCLYTIVMSCAGREREGEGGRGREGEGGREEGKPYIQLSQTFTPKSTHNYIHYFNT